MVAETVAEGANQEMLAALAVISLLGGVIVLLVKTYAQAKGANNAVNNVGPGDHSLWDQLTFLREDVKELREAQRDFTQRGWQALPDDLGTASGLTETIREIQRDISQIKDRIAEHDAWERDQKYRDDRRRDSG